MRRPWATTVESGRGSVETNGSPEAGAQRALWWGVGGVALMFVIAGGLWTQDLLAERSFRRRLPKR